MRKFRVMIVHDVHVDGPRGRIYWAYARRSAALVKYAPDDFEAQAFQFKEAPWHRCHEFDLVFNLEFAQTNRAQVKAVRDVPLVISWNADASRRTEWWNRVTSESDFVICNNKDSFEFYRRHPRTCAISNGIDADLWKPMTPVLDRPHRVIWTGSSNPAKGKNFQNSILPLQGMLAQHGFETDFRPINQVNPQTCKTTEEMQEWYNGASYVVCASDSEGTPGYVSEAVACGCVAVSSNVGNIREWGRDRENCVLTERKPEAILEGLLYAREHRERLSAASSALLRDEWSYGAPGNRAAYFYALFRKLIQEGRNSVKPFCFSEINASDI